jgi:hypothetical protein
MNGPVQYTANFGKFYTLTVTEASGANYGNGVVNSTDGQLHCASTCTVLYATGAKVTLNPVPNAISFFENWAGDCAGKNFPYTVTITRNMNCTAWFLPTLYDVQASHAGTGSGVVTSSDGVYNCVLGVGGPIGGPVCANKYPYASTITLTATPDKGSTFVSWSGTWLGPSGPPQAGCYNYTGGNQCVVVINSLRLPLIELPLTATFSGNYTWWPAVQSLIH